MKQKSLPKAKVAKIAKAPKPSKSPPPHKSPIPAQPDPQSAPQPDPPRIIDLNLELLSCLETLSSPYCLEHTRNSTLKQSRNESISKVIKYFTEPQKIIDYILPNISQVFPIIPTNLFRSLPVGCTSVDKLSVSDVGIGISSDSIDPFWPNLEGIYTIFYKLISTDYISSKHLKQYITPFFFQEFLSLFNSEEPKERDFLKHILQSLYFKLIPKRKMIKQSLDYYLLSVIHESQTSNGISELLEVLSSIISQYSIPLRPDNAVFFREIILPLHKVQNSQTFHEQLLRCVVIFLSKDLGLAPLLVKTLLRYWPVGNSEKEGFFLGEIMEGIKICEVRALEDCVGGIVRRVLRCMAGPHIEIARKAARLVEEEGFRALVEEFKERVIPVVAVIEISGEGKWNDVFREILERFREGMRDIDGGMYEEARKGKRVYVNYLNSTQNLPERALTEAKWDLIKAKALTIDPSLR